MKKVLFILSLSIYFLPVHAQHPGVRVRLKNTSDTSAIWVNIPVLDSGRGLQPKETTGAYLVDSLPKRFAFSLDEGRERWFNKQDTSKGYLYKGDWIVNFVFNPRNRMWRYTLYPYNADIDK